MKKLTTEIFIDKCLLKHKDKYNYSITIYENMRTNVDIICQKHGKYSINPNNHLNGQGCDKCRIDDKKIGIDILLERCFQLHNGKYDYSIVSSDYKSVKDKIDVICKEHGVFTTSIKNHLYQKRGCNDCRKLGLDNFIRKSNVIHNNKYDYKLVKEYNNNKEKVDIICKEHGLFTQKIDLHLLGQGCPVCRESKGEKIIRNYLISNNIQYIGQKTFDDCKYKRRLPFDFYLPDYDMCIEYNGRQHYEEVGVFGGIDELNKQIIKDKIKKDYCESNNIKLLSIKYDMNILDVIKKETL